MPFLSKFCEKKDLLSLSFNLIYSNIFDIKKKE